MKMIMMLVYILLNAGFVAILLKEKKEETESMVSENGGIMLALFPAIIIAGVIKRN